MNVWRRKTIKRMEGSKPIDAIISELVTCNDTKHVDRIVNQLLNASSKLTQKDVVMKLFNVLAASDQYHCEVNAEWIHHMVSVIITLNSHCQDTTQKRKQPEGDDNEDKHEELDESEPDESESDPPTKKHSIDVHAFLEELLVRCCPTNGTIPMDITSDEDEDEDECSGDDIHDLLDVGITVYNMVRVRSQHNLDLIRGWYIESSRTLRDDSWEDIQKALGGRAKKPSSSSALLGPLQMYQLVWKSKMYCLRHLQPKKGDKTKLIRHRAKIHEILQQDGDLQRKWIARAWKRLMG